MPNLARLYLRTSLVYLLVGAILGGLLLWNKGAPLWASVWLLLAAHVATMVWGWLLHLSLGVAYWMLPRRGGQRPRPWLAAAAYACLNAGIVLAALGGLLPGYAPGAWLNALGGLSLFLAALAFTLHTWPRVRPAGG